MYTVYLRVAGSGAKSKLRQIQMGSLFCALKGWAGISPVPANVHGAAPAANDATTDAPARHELPDDAGMASLPRGRFASARARLRRRNDAPLIGERAARKVALSAERLQWNTRAERSDQGRARSSMT
jgi:hypothetical protein